MPASTSAITPLHSFSKQSMREATRGQRLPEAYIFDVPGNWRVVPELHEFGVRPMPKL